MNRLLEDLVGARLEAAEAVAQVGVACDENDRREPSRRITLETAAHLETVQGRHEDEPPVECDVSVPPARSPPRALIADAHSREASDAVLGGKFPDSDRQFARGPRPQGDSFCGVDGRSGHPGTLSADPLEITCGKCLGLAFRTAARDRHAQSAVGFNPEKISAGAPVADEIQRREGDT